MKYFTFSTKFNPKNHTGGEHDGSHSTDEREGFMVIQAAWTHRHQQVEEAGIQFHDVFCSSLLLTPKGASKASTNRMRPSVSSEGPLKRHLQGCTQKPLGLITLQTGLIWFWPQVVWSRSRLISKLSHQDALRKGFGLFPQIQSTSAGKDLPPTSANPEVPVQWSGDAPRVWWRQIHVYKESSLQETVLKQKLPILFQRSFRCGKRKGPFQIVRNYKFSTMTSCSFITMYCRSLGPSHKTHNDFLNKREKGLGEEVS